MIRRDSYAGEPPRFSGAWWASVTRNFAWVCLVTVLIWVYADLEKTETRDFTIRISLTTGSAGNLDLPGANLRDLRVAVRGANTSIEDFQRWLQAHGGTLQYDVSRDYKPGPSVIVAPAWTVVSHAADLTAKGLSIASVEPATISFRLDRVIEVPDVPVEFQYTGATQVTAVVDPPKVNIRVAESAWEKVKAALPEAQRVLKTRQVDLANADTSKPIIAEIVPSIVIKPNDPDEPPVKVQPSRDTVSVTVQVKLAVATRTFTIVPRLEMPPAWADDDTWLQYKLVRKPNESWTKEITVTGPKTDVDSLKSEDIDAYVVLRDDDKKPTETFPPREVIVRFPAGLKVSLSEKPTVSFKLEKRTPAAPLPFP
ncbi:MAG: hypothetical protein ACE15C_05835 [Phycisphaerae bacterium]